MLEMLTQQEYDALEIRERRARLVKVFDANNLIAFLRSCREPIETEKYGYDYNIEELFLQECQKLRLTKEQLGNDLTISSEPQN